MTCKRWNNQHVASWSKHNLRTGVPFFFQAVCRTRLIYELSIVYLRQFNSILHYIFSIWLHEFTWPMQWIHLERQLGVREVMGSIPIENSDCSFSHARDVLIIQYCTFYFRAQKMTCHQKQTPLLIASYSVCKNVTGPNVRYGKW